MDKIVYAITGPIGCTLEELSGTLVSTVGSALAKELPDGTRIRVRIRDKVNSGLMAGTPWLAVVPFDGQQLPVDAVLDVALPETETDLSAAHAVLAAATSTYQGWRVLGLTLVDNRADPALGELSDYLGGGAFIQRMPGLSREQFWMRWQIHGAYGIANAKASGRAVLRQIYNRVVEPVTATSWVIDGYEEAATEPGRLESFGRASTARSFDDIAKGPGESQFFRMPAPVLFGKEILVAG